MVFAFLNEDSKGTVLVAIFIAVLVQSFFIHRIWILSGRKVWVTTIPAVLLFCRVCLGCVAVAWTWTIPYFPKFSTFLATKIALTFALSSSAAVDLIVASLSVYYLRMRHAFIPQTKHIINYLQVYFVNTGALTMTVSVAIVLTFVFMHDSFLFVGLVEIQSKLYANSFLAILNARQFLRNGRHDFADNTLSTSIPGRIPAGSNYSMQARPIEVYKSVAKATSNDAHLGIDLSDEVMGNVSIDNSDDMNITLGKTPMLM